MNSCAPDLVVVCTRSKQTSVAHTEEEQHSTCLKQHSFPDKARGAPTPSIHPAGRGRVFGEGSPTACCGNRGRGAQKPNTGRALLHKLKLISAQDSGLQGVKDLVAV